MATTSRAGDLTLQLERISLLPLPSSRFQKILDCDELPDAVDGDDKDCILSQDFFCTPDYLTPEGPQISNIFSLDKENACPKSPEKPTSKRRRIEGSPVKSVLMCDDQTIELRFDAFGLGEVGEERMVKAPSPKKSYVSQSAVALCCRALPPPCTRNPYLDGASQADLDIFEDKRLMSIGETFFITSNEHI